MLRTRCRNLETRKAEREAQAAQFEEKFDHCKHEACEEPEDTEVARELELFVQVYSCREFVYSPCTKIVAASSLLASGGREGGREEE